MSITYRLLSYTRGAALYRSVLGRYPTQREILSIQWRLMTRPRELERQINAMITSPEFWEMQAPDLLWNPKQEWAGQKVAFVHIPKTAGTSITSSLQQSMGVAPMVMYKRTRTTFQALNAVRYYPLIAGHQFRISDVPPEHQVITSLRYPLSRMLSQYRQSQHNRAEVKHNGHFARTPQEGISPKRYFKRQQMSFSDYLCDSLPRFRSYAWYFARAESPRSSYMYGDQVSASAIAGEISEATDRVSAILTAGGPSNLESQLAEALGKNITLPKANVRTSADVEDKPVQLTLDELEQMRAYALKDWAVIEALQESGRIKGLAREGEMEDFQRTAERLNFILPARLSA